MGIEEEGCKGENFKGACPFKVLPFEKRVMGVTLTYL